MPLTASSSSRALAPPAAPVLLRWLVAIGLLGLSACATAPSVSAVPPEPVGAAEATGESADRPPPPVSGAATSAAPEGGFSAGPVRAPATVASGADPVLEPVHATPADRSPGAGSVIARGTASWYGRRFHGRRTASGERFDMNGLTAAHRTLPFGTQVRVRHLATGREVVVRINDRGPASRGRIIDLSMGAARALGVQQRGTFEVQLLRE
jgi:rare lipoprotein A